MEESNLTYKANKKITKIITFPVPFTLGETNEELTISSPSSSKPSKEQVINQAFK